MNKQKNDTLIIVMTKLIQFKKILTRPLFWFKRLSVKRKIVVIAVFLVGISIAMGQIGSATQLPAYKTQKVERSNITEIVTESGNIVTSGRVDVYSPTNGVVEEIYVKNGDIVKEGDQLFKVESASTEQESQQAYSNYLASVAGLNNAQSTANLLRAEMYTQWKSFTDLATNGTYEKSDDTPNTDNRRAAEFQVAQDVWTASEKKYKDQQTAIAQAQAAVNSTNILYQATKDSLVKAQSDGVITNMSVSKGSSVTINNPMVGSSRPVLILSKDSQVEAQLLLSESDIAKAKEGQKATISINAIDNKKYNAVVDRVDTIGNLTQGVTTYTVYLRLTNADNNIRTGMTVDADITTKEIKNALTVPNSAVKPYQGGKAVRVPDQKSPSKFRYVPVIVGVRGEQKTEILKGLSLGQEIVTALQNEALKRPGVFGN